MEKILSSCGMSSTTITTVSDLNKHTDTHTTISYYKKGINFLRTKGLYTQSRRLTKVKETPESPKSLIVVFDFVSEV